MPLKRYVDVLNSPRRRHTLYYVTEHRTEAINIETVARYVKAFEVAYPPDTLVETDYTDVKRELYRVHLPQLDDDGILDVDYRNGVVEFQPSSRVLIVLLSISKLLERHTRGNTPTT